MRRLLLFTCLLLMGMAAAAQMATMDISELSYVPKQKFDSYISKKGFLFTGTSYMTDTIARDFDYRPGKADTIPVQRSVTSFSTKEDFSLIYRTTSAKEFQKIKADIKKEGFFCNREKDSLTAPSLLFQHNDVTVLVSSKAIDTLTEYSFFVKKQDLPRPKEISYAEDLVYFNSHEQLRFYFGEKNVQKDIYYLSDQQLGKCSVLFPNTSRQVVFLWADAANNCGLAKIYIGGQLMAASTMQYEQNIPENEWRLRDGIRPGMSLYQLRRLNDAAFNFNGGRSANTGLVATDSTGKLDFKKASIILGCMNCTDDGFTRTAVINSDDAIQEERILFVHTIILDPSRIKPAEKTAGK
ncbi:hypothetical protein [Ferruginibacter sp.]